MPILTKKQKQIFDYVVAKIKQNGFAPSYMEIADHFSLSSPATVHQHIKTIENKGYLKNTPNGKRSMEPVFLSNYQGLVIDLPLVGLITAGEPIEALETSEVMSLPSALARKPDQSYVLKVKGSSMIDEGIFDGDYVVVEKSELAKDGQVVVALIDNTNATLKKFYKEPGRIRLQPANPEFKPIYCRDVLIQGIVQAVIRKFT